MITVPRYVIVALAAVFSVYHLLLGTLSINAGSSPALYLLAMVLYAAATVLSLLPSNRRRMQWWLAALNVAVAVAVPILVTSQLGSGIDYVPGSDRSTWYVAAVGTLMVITSARRRHLFAWVGVASLVVQTAMWAGPEALASLGVVGSVLWVGVSHALSRSLDKAGRDARTYALAEREAAEWRAAQEAHLFERQFRLEQTSRMALPMLRHIVEVAGDLTVGQRRECLYLEGAIRDEIRGRKLLNDRVREQVMVARRRGKVVNLLDEGGVDDLEDAELERVHNELARAIRDTSANLIIARTVPEGSDVAVTVVGLSATGEGEARALGSEAAEDDEDRVDLWLEIPRALEL
ncbi:MAG TPA: hypothetical protein VFT01_10600 [Homoserinimonas sp.]|nr:hypothetical protein [Homoserinimonas sp.]